MTSRYNKIVDFARLILKCIDYTATVWDIMANSRRCVISAVVGMGRLGHPPLHLLAPPLPLPANQEARFKQTCF